MRKKKYSHWKKVSEMPFNYESWGATKQYHFKAVKKGRYRTKSITVRYFK